MILIDEHIDRIDISSSLELLPPERREKALAYRDELQQRQCIGAWLLLRKACSEVFGLNEVPPVAVGQHGKPYFPAMPRLHFNLSHCRVAVACAADHVPVGIDIECPRNFSDNLLSYVCSPEERSKVLAAENPPLSFAELWTKKESLYKLTGEGIRDNIKTILAERTDIFFETHTHTAGKYVCTLARYDRNKVES